MEIARIAKENAEADLENTINQKLRTLAISQSRRR